MDPNFKDYYGRTPLWWSASNGHVSVIVLLLKQDILPLNEPDNDGRTPLHKASGNGHKTIVQLLLNIVRAIENAKEAHSNRRTLEHSRRESINSTSRAPRVRVWRKGEGRTAANEVNPIF